MSKGLLLSAMSGGVDSSVATALALEAGYDVVGATLHLKGNEEAEVLAKSCCGSDDFLQVRLAAEKLGIKHEFLDRRAEFHEIVLRYSWHEYKSGRTPKPCSMCNAYIKFGLLADYARSIGAKGIITGHYANLIRNAAGHNELHHAKDSAKDQIYFLALLNQKQLDFCHMPLGGMCKSEVRAKAEALGLANAKKRESQDACFGVPGEAFSHTLKKYFNETTPGGNIVDTSGKVLGFHQGIYLYTVGQRKGLNVAMGVPAYVSEIRPVSNEVVLTTNGDDLLINEVELHNMNWLDEFPDALECMVQLRYRQPPLAAKIYHLPASDQLLIKLDKAISRPALGQVGAIYAGDRLLGGGIISRSAKTAE